MEHNLFTVIAVAMGGASGALSRYYVSIYMLPVIVHSIPYATLLVNVLGCFLAAICLVLVQHKVPASNFISAFLIIGFLGAFTTFSAFSIETIAMFEAGKYWQACGNIFLNLSLSLIAVIAAFYLAKENLRPY